MISSAIPTTSGENPKKFLKAFDAAKLDRGIIGKDDSDKVMAKYWYSAMEDNTPADTWYTSMSEEQKESYIIL